MAFSKEKAHERAERYAAKGQHDRAAREYQTIVEADPKDIRAWLMLADCLVRCGDRTGAVDRYLQVAGYYAAQKQSQKALAVYRQVVNLDPRRVDVHQKIAQLNLELGRVQDAVAIYEQVGHAQLQAGNTVDALVTFELIANAEPAAVSKRLRVAELYSRERQNDKAVEHFRLAGEQLLASGRKADYVRVAERLVYHKPDDDRTIRGLARAYLELKDPRRALMKLNALLHADPHDRDGLELLAETFLALEKPDKAVSVATELVRQLQSLGENGVIDAARVARRALAWDPSHPELIAASRAAPAGTESVPRSPTMPPEPSRPVQRREPPPARTEPTAAAPTTSAPAGPPRGRTEPQEPLHNEIALEPDVDLDDDVLEIDDDDVMSDSTAMRLEQNGPSTARQGRPEPARAAVSQPTPPAAAQAAPAKSSGVPVAQPVQSMTNRVLSEVDGEHPAVQDGIDLDKILFEARVYIKYRLFEHAIEHIGELLATQPEHVGALALRARALGELGRGAEAAQTHLRVAQLVSDRDPKLAREHVAAAIDGDPTNAAALALRDDLDAQSTPQRVDDDGDPDGGGPLDDGDSGTFDVVGDDVSGPTDLVLPREDHEFEIDVTEQPEEVVQTRPISVENRFGLSDARPLPDHDEPRAHEQALTEDQSSTLDQGLRDLADARRESPDKTPLFGFRARPPGRPEPATDAHPPMGDDAPPTDRFPLGRPVREPGVPETVRPGKRGALQVELDAEPSERHTLPQVPLDAAAIALQIDDDDSIAIQERDVPTPPKPAAAQPVVRPPPGPAPVAARPPARAAATPKVADLGDELAEVRFYLDQGLEDDARASLAELERRHPGHPEVAALQRELDRETAPSQQQSGATPLVDLSAEDEEEDAYLSAIFDQGPAKKKQDKSVEIRASEGLDPGDAATAYDLGMAYREMGLVDDALAQFETAARDPSWEARALVMSGTLRVHRGETDRALAELRRAIESATNEDELYEAKYELAVIYETLGETEAAREELQGVPAGYRERDEKLAALEG